MFDIRKIQEDVIYKAVKAESDEETARKVVYGGQQTKAENNPEWVKAAMHRLENSFDSGTVKQIRRNCQCGYGMEEKLALCLPRWRGWRQTPGASVPPGTARSFLKRHFPAGQMWSC